MHRRFALAAVVALVFVGATWPPVHPLVTRNDQATGPAPLGCDEALAPRATPRVNVAEIPEIVPVSMTAPPSRSLREELDAAHRALVRNDRPQFDQHLRAARAVLATYPAGAERSRAEEVIWALNDAGVLWDVQFESPFFDETSDAYARASRYAGYADAMRRSVFTDDRERRFYPAAESRDFVSRVAAERLQRLGVRASTPPSRVARAETRRTETVSPSPAPQRTRPSTSTRRAEPSASAPRAESPASTRRSRSSSPSPRRTASVSSSKPGKPAAVAASAPSSSPDRSERPASSAPAASASAAPAASSSLSRAGDDVPASPVTEVPPPSAADLEPESVPTITPLPESSDVTTTTAAPASPEPSAAVPTERRSVIVPSLLILIGLGVLIVLFRASK